MFMKIFQMMCSRLVAGLTSAKLTLMDTEVVTKLWVIGIALVTSSSISLVAGSP
jgi:hypothetical protein